MHEAYGAYVDKKKLNDALMELQEILYKEKKIRG